MTAPTDVFRSSASDKHVLFILSLVSHFRSSASIFPVACVAFQVLVRVGHDDSVFAIYIGVILHEEDHAVAMETRLELPFRFCALNMH